VIINKKYFLYIKMIPIRLKCWWINQSYRLLKIYFYLPTSSCWATEKRNLRLVGYHLSFGKCLDAYVNI